MPALEPLRRPQSRSGLALAAGVALLLLTASIAGLSALREDTDRMDVRSPDAGAGEAPGEGRAPKPALSGPIAVPAGVLAVHDHGTELALVDTVTGKRLRTLVDLGPYPTDGSEEEQAFWPVIDGLAVTSDGRWAYYSVGPEPAVGQLFRVATAGGKPESLGDGDQPTVSPDGRLLAHRSLQAVLVRDIVSGKTQRWEADAEFTESPMRLAWTRDSRLLAVETVSSPGSSAVRVLDVSRPQPLMHTKALRSPLSAPGRRASARSTGCSASSRTGRRAPGRGSPCSTPQRVAWSAPWTSPSPPSPPSTTPPAATSCSSLRTARCTGAAAGP